MQNTEQIRWGHNIRNLTLCLMKHPIFESSCIQKLQRYDKARGFKKLAPRGFNEHLLWSCAGEVNWLHGIRNHELTDLKALRQVSAELCKWNPYLGYLISNWKQLTRKVLNMGQKKTYLLLTWHLQWHTQQLQYLWCHVLLVPTNHQPKLSSYRL